ncbi:hypothetical protein R50072_17540 [Simiduia litorea]|uniref:hypothetical protein n=1 Tax=Simiduia litorea TaxID=1435348 RepID=UPI0036F1D6ED
MTTSTQSLSPAISKKITDLCSTGYVHYDAQDFELALRTFYQAWVLVPKPQTQFAEAGWILTALCDAYFRLARLPQALEAANSALFCPKAEQNYFVLFRKGQIMLDQGELAKARAILHKAYSHGGAALFEQENSKYREAIDDLIN